MQVDLRHRGLQCFDPAEFANTEEHLQLLLQVRQLDVSYNSMYDIRGLEGLTHLTALNISHNGLRSLSGGLPLTLRELDASHNNLASLENAALLPLEFLTSLNVAFNALEDLRGVPSVTAQLTYLDVRSNRLTSLMGIEHCSQLHTLHAEANLLRKVEDVASIKCLPNLKAVFLSGNPLLLRKRQLSQLYILLPSHVEQDDLPTTAPPSSVRSSTAAPPSVLDTSSVGTMDHSTGASMSELHEGMYCGSGQSSWPPSARRITTPQQTHCPASSNDQKPPSHDTNGITHRSPTSAANFPATTTAALAGGVVGSASDSSTCPRRALPREHRLGEIPGSASLYSSPDRTHRSSTSGLLHNSDSRGVDTANPLPSHASSTLGGYTGKGDSDFLQDDLKVQLARVTAERDECRQEILSLRRELRELQRKCVQQRVEGKTAGSSRLTQTSARRSSALSLDGEVQKEGVSSLKMLAVEMSAHSSVCAQDGEVHTPKSPNNRHNLHSAPRRRDLGTCAGVHSSPPASLNKTHNAPSITSSPVCVPNMNRREMAALFMAQLRHTDPPRLDNELRGRSTRSPLHQ